MPQGWSHPIPLGHASQSSGSPACCPSGLAVESEVPGPILKLLGRNFQNLHVKDSGHTQSRTTLKMQPPRFTGTEAVSKDLQRNCQRSFTSVLVPNAIPSLPWPCFPAPQSRAELEQQDHRADSLAAPEKPAKDRALMRKEGANEKGRC